MTRLDAINQMLAAIGQAPVTTTTSQHPDVLAANNIMYNRLEQLQQPGAWYNKEHRLLLSYDVLDGSVPLPSNTLRVDPVDVNLPYVRRESKLYDPLNSTFAIYEDVLVDLVLLLDFEDVPTSAQHYIAADCSYRLHLDAIGDEHKLARLYQFYIEARGVYRGDELKNSDFNARNTPTASRLLTGVRPYGRWA